MGKIGVLTEQGFVQGSGLGFTPIKESELNNKQNEKDQEDRLKKK